MKTFLITVLFLGNLVGHCYSPFFHLNLSEHQLETFFSIDDARIRNPVLDTPASISGIINEYTPITAINMGCSYTITVKDASKFKPGDTVLIIQMKGAIIDSSNTAAFGTITNYANAGNYEFNFIKRITGNVIELQFMLERLYDIPAGSVQLIRVPYYKSVSVTGTLTCLPWDGEVGGVLVLNAKDTISLDANIDVSGRGFRGGQSKNSFFQSLSCFNNGFFYPVNTNISAAKGEGIYQNGAGIAYGKGANANGGGGGNGHNSGGGGGGNAGTGGYQLEQCGSAPFDNRGLGGLELNYTAKNKLFMGGGGGSGHTDNQNGVDMNGGNGGGIVLISAATVLPNGYSILARGSGALNCNNNLNNCHDGNGGGGAGGSIVIDCQDVPATLRTDASGGKGGDLVIYVPQLGGGRIGPGGGGGGGYIGLSSQLPHPSIDAVLSGGASGVILEDNNNTWGATEGKVGLYQTGHILPISSTPFQPNIDSLKISDTIKCSTVEFTGTAFTRLNPVQSWFWQFGDGATANINNPVHQYTATGTYEVKLTVTDTNGCTDSLTNLVDITPVFIQAGNDTTVCGPQQVQLFASGAADYSWTPATGLSDAGIANPVATVSSTTKYFVSTTAANGCTATDSMLVTVNSLPLLQTNNDTAICSGSTIQLLATGAATYNWQPATGLSNASVSNPAATPLSTTQYVVTGTSAGGCTATDTINITVNTAPVIFISNDTSICGPQQVQLFASGAADYSWTPATGLSDAGIANPVATVSSTTKYFVSTTAANGCTATDSMLVTVNSLPLLQTNNDTAICSGSTIQLLATGAATYNWQPATGLSNASVSNPAATPLSTTQYVVTGTSAGGCTATDTINITVNTAPVIFAGNDTTVCAGTSITLQATGANAYSWLPAASLSNSTVANPVATIQSTAIFTVTGTDINGCSGSDQVQVVAIPPPSITVSGNTATCAGKPVQLLAAGADSYNWFPSATLNNAAIANPVATPATTTTYYVQAVNNGTGCTTLDSLTVTVGSLSDFSISPGSSVCAGTPFTLSASGGNAYQWQPAAVVNNPAAASVTASIFNSTTFSVKITNSECNDSAILSTTVLVSPAPVLRVTKSNDIDCYNDTVQLQVTGADTYLWTSGILPLQLNSNTIANPVSVTQQERWYYVTGTSTITGCSSRDSIFITAFEATKPAFYAPNSFTPNGDGLNDCYRVITTGTPNQFELSIHNRYGQKVFTTQNPNDCWDGTFKGKKQDPGNFVVYIWIKNNCIRKSFKSNLLLLR
ncbi:MAG TPA: PKD domain-containing protein [Ferruginibacter sp.]|nr:PKD domain-containing protein [Ferruginibacter sp.]